MKVRNYLDAFFNDKVLRILRVFVRIPNAYTGRQMSVITNMNHQTCTTYLEDLCDCDVLKKRVAGRSYLYEIRDNYFTKTVLIPVIRSEQSLYEQLKKKLRQRFKECTAIVVYGSYARGDEQNGSDWDICFIVSSVTSAFQKKLNLFIEEMKETYVLTVSPHVLFEQEVKEKNTLPVLQDIRKEGDWIVGDKRELVNRLW